MALTRDAFIKARSLKFQEVPTPELGAGASVIVREMNALEMEKFATLSAEVGDKIAENMRYMADILVMVCVDDEGAQLFTAADTDMLMTHSAALLKRLMTVALELTSTSVDSLKAGLTPKNSESVPSASLP